jgi:RNA recognition motif-containing protein
VVMAIPSQTDTVFVGNLAWATMTDGLRMFCEQAGPVASVTIQLHEDSGRSKGWA